MSVVLLADAKAQLNIEPGFTNDDALIQEMIDAAEDWITKFVVAPIDPSCAPDPCLPANPITSWPPVPPCRRRCFKRSGCLWRTCTRTAKLHWWALPLRNCRSALWT